LAAWRAISLTQPLWLPGIFHRIHASGIAHRLAIYKGAMARINKIGLQEYAAVKIKNFVLRKDAIIQSNLLQAQAFL
jgi:hypothetical protein